jgi:hypothetical protein
MNPDVIANTVRNTRAAAEVVKKLTSKILLQNDRQGKLDPSKYGKQNSPA